MRLEQLGSGVDPRFRLARARFRTPPQPGELASGEVSSDCLCRRGTVVAFGSSFEIRSICALMKVATTAIELKHSCRDAIEEMAIVADDHESASKCEELILEPRNSTEIKMVCRLVEHEQLGGPRECAS
jgi:hypothetical protein